VHSKKQRVSREWRLLTDDLKTPPHLDDVQKDEVKEMLRHSQDRHNWRDEKSVVFDFNQVVTEDTLRRHFSYFIPAGKVPLDKKGNPSKKATTTGEVASGCAEKP
jgi:hypothetical protein